MAPGIGVADGHRDQVPDAGADHVILTTIGGDFAPRIDLLERVAPAVTTLTRKELSA